MQAAMKKINSIPANMMQQYMGSEKKLWFFSLVTIKKYSYAVIQHHALK